MREKGYSSALIFGDMSVEEREEMLGRFRKLEANVLITTNLIARGIDIPELKLVIHFEVSTFTENGVTNGDPGYFLHRNGHIGRFGTHCIALTLYDCEEDETYLDQI